MRKTLLLICAMINLSLISSHAQIIARVENAFIDEGWSFWWNPNGYASAGQPAFEQMVLTQATPPEAAIIYGPSSSWPSSDLRAGVMYIGHPALDGRVGGLTGTGDEDGQGEGVPRLPRATIWAFTVSQSGVFEIQNLSFQFQGSSVDGASLNVFLSSGTTDLFGQNIAAGASSLNVSSINLGFLNEGDTIFVAVGPNGNNYGDNYFINYDIVAVPEPSAMGLALGGILVNLVMIRKKRNPLA